MANDDTTGEAGGKPISLLRLTLALLGPVLVVIISNYLKLQIANKVITGVARSIIQLLLAGYVLLGFVFSMRSPIFVMAYILVMSLIAALETTSRQIRTYKGHFYDSLAAVVLGGVGVGAYGAIVVFDPVPWWEPHIFVPSAGMIIGNSITGPSLAVDRLLAEIADKRHESETRLAFGAKDHEAVLPVVRSALLAALTPTLNVLNVVGLVSIPGMMTGQLLGGSPPLVAAEYQLSILWLICVCACISTFVGLRLAISHAVFDNNHRLATHKIVKREGKLDIEMALLQSCIDCFFALKYLVVGFAQRLGLVPQPIQLASSTDPSEANKQGSGSSYTSLSLEDRSTHNLILDAASSHSFNAATTFSIEGGDGDDEVGEEGGETKEDAAEKGTGNKPARSLLQQPHDGKVIASMAANDCSGTYPELQRPLVGEAFFYASAFNVLSGNVSLFSASEGLTFSVRKGERIVASGPSGLGKTRMLRAIAQLDEPLNGTLSFLPQGESKTSTPKWRRKCIYVPQAVPPLAGTPKELLSEALQYDSRAATIGAITVLSKIDDECKRMEESLGLSAGKLDEAWLKLSGGERQRAAIGVALILACCVESDEEESPSNPASLLLLDEPTAACDEVTKTKVERAIIASGVASIIVTHDERQAMRLAHRTLTLTLASSSE